MSSADTDNATGPPALPVVTSTMTEGRGRLEGFAVDVGGTSASRRHRIAVRARTRRPLIFADERPPGPQ